MTILQLISSEGYYGAESMLVTLSQTLAGMGCDIVVATFRDARNQHVEVAESARRLGLSVRIIDCNGRWDFSAVRRIRRALREDRVDVLHTHGYKADLYGYAANRPPRAATVSTCHSWPSRRLSMRAYAVLDRIVLRGFDSVTTPSDEVAEILKRSGIDPAKLSCIANGVEFGRFQSAAPDLRTELGCGTKPIVGFVGRLAPEKGGATLLEAAAKVLSEFPDVLFAFVGDGPLRADWESLAVSLGIADQVIFTGVREDMPGVYASFDILASPSFKEAMPMCLLEAQASARAVIGTRVGSVPELIEDGVTGLLLEPGDTDGLAKAILRLLRDPQLRTDLGRNGRTRVSQIFSSDAMARKYLTVYQQSLGKAVSERTHSVTVAK